MSTQVHDQPAVTASSKKSYGSRLGFLDWARGCAALIMLQGHIFHSFTATDLRQGSIYNLSQFLGGMPPAIFLFLTGCTFSFLMNSNEKKGIAPWTSVRTCLSRAFYLWGLAFAFRFQLWIFGLPSSPWTDLFKVDILNCMGITLAAASLTALWTTRQRATRGALLGLVVAGLSPLVSAHDWSAIPVFVRSYFVPDYNQFSFFPWAAFVPFGIAFGSVLRLIDQHHLERLLQWTSIAAFGPVAISELSSHLLMEASTLSRNLRALRTAGYVEWQEGSDRRPAQISLSDEGHKALAAAIPAWQEMQRGLTQRLGSGKASALLENLETAARALAE